MIQLQEIAHTLIDTLGLSVIVRAIAEVELAVIDFLLQALASEID